MNSIFQREAYSKPKTKTKSKQPGGVSSLPYNTPFKLRRNTQFFQKVTFELLMSLKPNNHRNCRCYRSLLREF